MKMKILLFLSAVLAISCSSKTKREQAQSVDSKFQLREFQEETLPNGLRILWIPDQSLPRISLNMMLATGSLNDEKGEAGLNSLTANLLDQGTQKKSAIRLAAELDQVGTDFNQAAGSDYTTLSSIGLSLHKDKILGLFAEIIQKPSFRDSEIKRRKGITIAALEKRQDDPSAFAEELAERQIFGAHPYGTSAAGTVKSVTGLRRSDVLRQYFTAFRPNNAILSVVGQFDDGFKDQVRGAFKGWAQATEPKIEHAAAVMSPAKTILVHKAGLQQTQIRMGHLGIRRSDPDFMALRMGNLILGGAFASRLNQRVRDDLGLTYSISSSSDAKLETGSFEVSTFTRHEKMADAILESKKVIQEFVTKGITADELKAAKALMIGQFPGALETPDRLATNLMILRRYGISDDYLRNFQQTVRSMTLDQVNQAVRKHIFPDKLITVIYTDEKAIESQLPRLGPVEKSEVVVE